jgi:hypothetical protein
MSKVGLYRYKTSVVEGEQIELYINGNLTCTHTIKELPFCEGSKIIKFLDSKGQYRFYSFTKYFEINDSPSLIGSTNEFITNIRTAKSNSKILGYKNERVLNLFTDVSEEQLPFFTDIYVSPRIYLYTGAGLSDLENDWLEVSIVGGDKIVKRGKARGGKISIDVQLPEWFSIKQI